MVLDTKTVVSYQRTRNCAFYTPLLLATNFWNFGNPPVSGSQYSFLDLGECTWGHLCQVADSVRDAFRPLHHPAHSPPDVFVPCHQIVEYPSSTTSGGAPLFLASMTWNRGTSPSEYKSQIAWLYSFVSKGSPWFPRPRPRLHDVSSSGSDDDSGDDSSDLYDEPFEVSVLSWDDNPDDIAHLPLGEPVTSDHSSTQVYAPP